MEEQRSRPPDDERLVVEEEEAAAAEAAQIGGFPGPDDDEDEEISEAQRPLIEAGEGEAEGFEEAEHQLIEHASHGNPSPDPTEFAGKPEERVDDGEYGEADHVESTEVEDIDE